MTTTIIIGSVIVLLAGAFLAGYLLTKKIQAYFDSLHSKVDALIFKLSGK